MNTNTFIREQQTILKQTILGMNSEQEFRKRTNAWHARLLKFITEQKFDCELNSMQKFVQLICRRKKAFDIGAFVANYLRPADYAYPPWTVSDDKVLAMLQTELHACATLCLQTALNNRRNASEDAVRKECRASLEKANLKAIMHEARGGTFPLLGAYNPVNDRIYERTNPLLWHLRALRHSLTIVIRERIRSKDWVDLPDQIDLGEECEEIAKAIEAEITRLVKPTPKRIDRECQAEFVQFVITDLPQLINKEQEGTRGAFILHVQAWCDDRKRNTATDYANAMSPKHWEPIEKYFTALGARLMIDRVSSVAQAMGPNPEFEAMSRKASSHWNPAALRFEARVKLSGASNICSRDAGYAAIRRSLHWLLGEEKTGVGQEVRDSGDAENSNLIFQRLLKTIEQLVFADTLPTDRAREEMLAKLKVETNKIANGVARQLEWFVEDVNGLIATTNQQRITSAFTLNMMKTNCSEAFAALVSPESRYRPFSADLIDVLRELIDPSNLRPTDPSLVALVRDLIPLEIDLTFVKGNRLVDCGHRSVGWEDRPVDWAAATFAVVALRVSPVDEKTPLSTSDLVSIYVSQLLCNAPSE